MKAHTKQLRFEMAQVHKVERSSFAFWFSICGFLMILFIALACWIEGILRAFSRKTIGKKTKKGEPFLDQTEKSVELYSPDALCISQKSSGVSFVPILPPPTLRTMGTNEEIEVLGVTVPEKAVLISVESQS